MDFKVESISQIMQNEYKIVLINCNIALDYDD